MKHIKLFEDYKNFNDDEIRQLGELGYPRKFRFESPIYVTVDFERWFDWAQNYSPKDFVRLAEKLDFDFDYLGRQYEDGEISEEEFWDEAWEEVKRLKFPDALRYSGIVDKRDFEDDIIDSFNEAGLEEYCEVPGVERITAKEVTDDGMFAVEVMAEPNLDIDAMKEYLSGQYSDGWGEGYEQVTHDLPEGVNFNIHTWSNRNDFKIELVNP